MRINRRFIFCLMAFGVAGIRPAFSEPEFLDTFVSHYHIKDTSHLGQKSCGICHLSEDETDKFNPYGKQLKEYMAAHNLTKVDDAVLTATDSMDANGDGRKNGDTIRADQDPGVVTPATLATNIVQKQPPSPLIPKNGFHPAIVHFPIALLISGLLIDFVGLVWKKQPLLLAGWYNLVLGAVSSFGAVASGLYAMTMMKLPYKGLIFIHLKLAILTTVLMWIMVMLRVHRHERMKLAMRFLYYVLAAGAFIAIAVAGHLGGKFVYGD